MIACFPAGRSAWRFAAWSACAGVAIAGCTWPPTPGAKPAPTEPRPVPAPAGARTYYDEVSFLRKHTRIIELQQGRAAVAIAPELQGRVMTSGFRTNAASLGWVSRDAVKTGPGDTQPFHNYGGQDRFWLGPEGGRFSLFFSTDEPQTADQWHVPQDLDLGPFDVLAADAASVRMRKSMKITSAAGAEHRLDVDRTIRLVARSEAAQLLDITVPNSVEYLGFVSENRITNVGPAPMTAETGTVSIWSVGMFPGKQGTVMILPYNAGEQGRIVRSDYFDSPPPDRLVVDEEARVVLLRGDGKFQCKIGLGPSRAVDRLGSIDFALNVLTIVHFDKLGGQRYVNSRWGVPQDDPFDGDVTNAYNHHGKFWGSYCELETSSPAAFLAPGESLAHYHRTLQFHAPIAELSKISERVLGVGLERVQQRMK